MLKYWIGGVDFCGGGGDGGGDSGGGSGGSSGSGQVINSFTGNRIMTGEL